MEEKEDSKMGDSLAQSNPTLGTSQSTKPGHSHLQHLASHCPNHVFEALQNSYPTAVVQQMGSHRDDLKGRKSIRAASAKATTFILLNTPNPLDKWHCQHSSEGMSLI